MTRELRHRFATALLVAAVAGGCAGRGPVDAAGDAAPASAPADATADAATEDGRRAILLALEETLRSEASPSDDGLASTLESLQEARERLVAAGEPDAFYDELNDVLAAGGNPHLYLYRPGRDLFDRDAGATRLVGATLRSLDGYHFVDDVWEGGPADEAGLLFGDQLLPIDGKTPVLDPLPEGTRSVRLWVRRQRDSAPFFVDIDAVEGPTLWYLAESSRASIRVESRDGCRIGVLHLRTFSDRDLIEELVTGAHFDGTDGMILDLRGNRGGEVRLAGELFDLLSRRPSVWIHYRDRIYSFPPTSWNRPLAVLVDPATHSAAEIFAAAVQVLGLGTVVGMPTAGRVQASRLFDLPDGSQLLMPVSRVTLPDGTDLEARGVVPHVPVERPLMYAAGADPQMERAFALLGESMVCAEELPEETFPQESVGPGNVR